VTTCLPVGRGLARVCEAVVVYEDRALMPFRACTVKFLDFDGVLQTAKVDAETASATAGIAGGRQTLDGNAP
jgi:hypothetical protein